MVKVLEAKPLGLRFLPFLPESSKIHALHREKNALTTIYSSHPFSKGGKTTVDADNAEIIYMCVYIYIYIHTYIYIYQCFSYIYIPMIKFNL